MSVYDGKGWLAKGLGTKEQKERVKERERGGEKKGCVCVCKRRGSVVVAGLMPRALCVITLSDCAGMVH